MNTKTCIFTWGGSLVKILFLVFIRWNKIRSYTEKFKILYVIFTLLQMMLDFVWRLVWQKPLLRQNRFKSVKISAECLKNNENQLMFIGLMLVCFTEFMKK